MPGSNPNIHLPFFIDFILYFNQNFTVITKCGNF